MNATLTWNANTESDLAGYIVFHGISTGIYTPADQVTVLAPTTTYTYTNLDVGIIHYFQVKAFDTTGNVSLFSISPGEVSKFEPYPVYPMLWRTPVNARRLQHIWQTEMDDRKSGWIAEVLGLNIPPVEPPPPDQFPIYEAIGGFMIV